ncbi:MAG: T9SS type A sorting domain-containing protein [Bacteroidetes bacterium]|nr:T9SS type A sorting domain-containing protein [Bacteroidota bacterium]
MNQCLIFRMTTLLSLLLLCTAATGMAQHLLPEPRYVPPDLGSSGFEAHYEYMAVLETDCRNNEDATQLVYELTRQGAVVAIVSSPGRMLAWVPPEARGGVESATLRTPDGEARVRAVAYTSEELRAAEATQAFAKREYNEADEAIALFIDWIRQPLTPERQFAREQAELRYQALRDQLPNDAPVDVVTPTSMVKEGGGGTEIMYGGSFASAAFGTVDHTSFFLESQTGSGTWDWPTDVYNDYKTLYVNALVYWSAEATKYGKSMTTFWHLYGRTHWACQLNGEAVVIREENFIPTVIDRVTSGLRPLLLGFDPHEEWALKYNRDMRSSTGHSQSIIGFIAYKGTPDEGIWPHASVVTWGNGKTEGMYFALDTQYWQAVPDPLANPYRNVIAHEIGHLWGAPDEYHDRASSCAWSYRGIANDNCQRNRTDGPYHLRGWDGMMKGNYMGGTSRATPVHTGVLAAADAVPRRLFRTVPERHRLTLTSCDGSDKVLNTGTYIPMSHDYCFTIAAEPTHVSGSTTWYFQKWETKYKDGSTMDYALYGPNLSGSMLSSSRTNPITEMVAHYTNSPPDFMAVNSTLQAWNSHFNHNPQPVPNIALRWVNRYNMNEVKTIVEYDRSGNWVPLSTSNIVLYHPNSVPVGRFTGLRVHSVPLAGGTNQNIQPNREYRFRIVGEYNTVRGTPSVVATVRTRPATPADTVFCYDANEPNGQSSPKTLPSMGPGIDEYAVHGSLTIDGASGEFSWYRPKADYYRITAIGLATGLFGNKLKLRLKVREGSDFLPLFEYQRAGTTTWNVANFHTLTEEYVLTMASDGEYLVRVDADITNIGGMVDLADRYTGNFGFGMYRFTVDVEPSNLMVRPFCHDCVRLTIPRPYPGLIIMEPPLPPDLVLPTRAGFDRSSLVRTNMHYISPPGTGFEGFEGTLFGGTQNPLLLEIGPNTPAGEYLIYPKVKDLDIKVCELVLINPEGPGGPLQERVTKPYGTLYNAEATAPAGFVFVGWGGDTTATTNPLPVVMWRHKMIIARFRQKPCVPEKMPKWEHLLTVMHAKQGSIRLTYGMQGGAGDGLEPGQVDLPPIPPPGTFDVRWLNIPGSQGSVTDIRDIKPTHVYQGRVQVGSGMAPARIVWSPPGLGTSFTMSLKVGSNPAVDMHSVSEYMLSDEGVYTFTITVKEPDCAPPSEESDITVDIERIDPKEFPCLDLELLLKNRRTGDPLPYANPFGLSIYENSGGKSYPAQITMFTQLDSTLVLRFCANEDNEDPNREISIIPEEENPDKIKDTTNLKIPFIPDVTEEMFQLRHVNSGDWEMVSIPVRMTDGAIGSLYPDPATKLFRFDKGSGMYVGVDAMKLGEGYWLKTSTPTTLFVGNEVTTLTLNNLSGIGEPYGYGWNMIGAISHSVPFSSITQNPSGCLKAAFGWNPVSGYTTNPPNIEPTVGYWARLDPGAELTITGTGGEPPTPGPVTQYDRVASALPSAGMLIVRTGPQGGQRLTLASRTMTEEETDALLLPQAPPGELFDVRTDDGTLFVPPGGSVLRLQHDGVVTLALHPRPGAIEQLRLFDENGVELHGFRTDAPSEITVPVHGTRLLRLAYSPVAQPLRFAIGQSYPNPFRPGETVVLQYSLDRDASVRLDVHDMLGRRVATVTEGMRQAGEFSATWTGFGFDGRALPAGIYTYRLEAGGRVLTARCSILR